MFMSVQESPQTPVVPLRWRPTVTFGTRLRLVRLAYGERVGKRVTQEDMATAIGVNANTYKQWEADHNKPKDFVAMVKRVTLATGADPAWILGLDDDASSPPPTGVGAPSFGGLVRDAQGQPDNRCSSLPPGQGGGPRPLELVAASSPMKVVVRRAIPALPATRAA